MRIRAVAVAIAALALIVAGCGQTGGSSAPEFKGAEKAVADVVADLQTAGSRKKPEDICDKLVTPALKEQIAEDGSDCQEEMKKAVEDADAFELEVTDVTISGSTATAKVKNVQRGEDTQRTFELALADGDWRISSFG